MARTTRDLSLAEPSVRFANGTILEAPGLSAEVTQWTATGAARSAMLPAERDMSIAFDNALRENGIDVQETIHIDVQALRGGLRGPGVRSTADRVTLRPTAPPPGHRQVVLYQDESGGMSWHFSDEQPGGAPSAARAASRKNSFTIELRTAAARAAMWSDNGTARLRGPVTKLGRKIFKVLIVPLSNLVAPSVQKIIGKVERKYRNDFVRAVDATNYRKRATEPFNDWQSLRGKPALLIVHGIFSTTDGMLSRLPSPVMERLVEHYGGRVIALDQYTASKSPEENASDFLKTAAAAGGPYTFDILCHSRGGIVSRTLAERGKALVPAADCTFRKIFFVATPNAGSRLADPEHIVDMIDVFTNLLTNFPDGPVMYSIEVLLALVKLVAHSAAAHVPGIASMGRSGYIADVLNASAVKSPAIYAAAASDYEPSTERDNGFVAGPVGNRIIDRVFEGLPNDLVVPRDGVFAENGHPSFPILAPLVYKPSDSVWHTEFFGRQTTIERILPFFEVPASPLVMATPTADIADTKLGGGATTAYDPLELGRLSDLLLAGTAESAETPARLPVAERRTRGKRLRGGNGGRTTAPAPAAEAKTSEASAQPATLERKPEIDFHESVVEGETNDLVVRLADVIAQGEAGNVLIDLMQDEDEVKVTVMLSAPGFRVEPGPEAPMTVKRTRDAATESVTFRLTALNPGREPRHREIIAEFWLRNASIGTVTHGTYVIPTNYDGQRPFDGKSTSEPFARPKERRSDCDLVIFVEAEKGDGQPPFRLRIRTRLPDEEIDSLDCGVFQVPAKDLSTYVNGVIQQAIATYPAGGTKKAVEDWNAAFMQRLKELGKELWNYLPEKFRDEYVRLYRNDNLPASILVHSDEMIFPWELVVPNGKFGRSYEELPPFGIAHILGRWKPGKKLRPYPQRMRAEALMIIRPKYAPPDELPWAAAEEQALRKLLKGATVLEPAIDASVRTKLLARDDVRVVHFSGHGEFDAANADLSTLLLENDTTIDALAVKNTRLGNDANPILYLNACSVGSVGYTVGRPGGFAAGCIDGGYSGIIAPYWQVNDASAAQLSIALYKRLIAGAAIGEALRDLRDKNRDNPAYLAFAYYGDPFTRVDLRRVVDAPAAAADPRVAAQPA